MRTELLASVMTTSQNRTEQFGDSCVICTASATVEDWGSATLAFTGLCTPTHVLMHMSMARTCIHVVARTSTRAHAQN